MELDPDVVGERTPNIVQCYALEANGDPEWIHRDSEECFLGLREPVRL